MSTATIAWIAALGAVLLVLPGLNLFAFVLLAFALGTGTERVLAPSKGYKELR